MRGSNPSNTALYFHVVRTSEPSKAQSDGVARVGAAPDPDDDDDVSGAASTPDRCAEFTGEPV